MCGKVERRIGQAADTTGPGSEILQNQFLVSFVLIVLTGVCWAQSSNDARGPHPDPRYSAHDVIRIQIEALAHNDTLYKDAGIETTFRFASPSNRLATGPLDRFKRMVHNLVYRPMLNHLTAWYGELRVQGDHAVQELILTLLSGERVGYVFIVSRQRGIPCDGCWMTDSVLRITVPDIEDPEMTNKGSRTGRFRVSRPYGSATAVAEVVSGRMGC